MRSDNIFSGDFLPEYRKVTTQDGEVRYVPRPQRYKDGESPGQEWNRNEAAAIRALANPLLATDARAAKAARVTFKKLRRWKRNPYFMNAVYELSSHFLKQFRTKVMRAMLKQACRGSFQDRQLFFKLTGELKDERRIRKTQDVTVREGVPQEEMDAQLADDLNSLSSDAADALENFSRRKPR